MVMSKLSIIIPTYNEAENIRKLIPAICESLSNHNFEIIVVDDNSPDGTAEIVKKLKDKYNNIKILKRPRKLGLASAVVDGLKLAEGDVIAVMDADFQHPPDLLPKMLEKIKEGYDLVIASRYVKGGSNRTNLIRKIISKGAVISAKILLSKCRGIEDPVSGFFMVKRDKLPESFTPLGFKILLEIIEKGKWRSVYEIPYEFKARKRGKSKLNLKEIMLYIKLLLKLSNYRILKFALVGLSGVIVNMGLLYFLVEKGLNITTAGLVAIESSILSNFLLNDLWTFKDRRDSSFLSRCFRYHLSVAFGGLVNYIVLLGLTMISIFYLFANLIGIALGFVANYLGGEYVVWRKTKSTF